MSSEASFHEGTLTITRHYDAPRERVFEAWIVTSKVQQWWGCAQTVAVRSEIEPKVGGAYNHHMTLEGGHEMPGDARFVEYDPPNKLAFTSDGPVGPMTVTVEFSDDDDGGTLVRLTHDNIPTDPGPPYLPTIIEGGWTAGLGKLADMLQEEVG